MTSATSDAAALRGAGCPACGVATYPPSTSCPRCGHSLHPLDLSRRGKLWTWTVQRYPPKSPPYVPRSEIYQPFVVGYVELPDGLRVEAVVDVPVDEVAIGMDLDLYAADGVPYARAVGA